MSLPPIVLSDFLSVIIVTFVFWGASFEIHRKNKGIDSRITAKQGWIEKINEALRGRDRTEKILHLLGRFKAENRVVIEKGASNWIANAAAFLSLVPIVAAYSNSESLVSGIETVYVVCAMMEALAFAMHLFASRDSSNLEKLAVEDDGKEGE